MPPALTRRQLTALRALAAGPGGIRHGAYPSAMQTLAELGLVRDSLSRTWPRRPIWVLTTKGRQMVKVVGTGEPRE